MIKTKKKNKTIAFKKKAKNAPYNVNVVIMIDASGSMRSWTKDTLNAVNTQLQAIKENSEKKIPGLKETLLAIGTFNTVEVGRGLTWKAGANIELSQFENIKDLGEVDESSYITDGGTPLRDAVVESIQHIEKHSSKNDANMLIVLTDGQENCSKNTTEDCKNAILTALATDKWTFAFCVPPGATDTAANFGIPKGCITEWEQSKKGYSEVAKNVTRGIQATYACYANDSFSNRSFFIPQVEDLTKTDVKRNLTNVSNQFMAFFVKANDNLVISDFFRKKGVTYEVGRGFYQLTKAETVQDFKDLVIKENSTGSLYAGEHARDLLGIPAGGTIKLNPAFSAKWTVYVRSTSWNRKLVAGTEVLYFTGQSLKNLGN